MFERCLYFNANALGRALNRTWEKAFHEFGVSPAHAYLLRLVLSHPGVSQKAVGTELKLEKSTVTRFIDALERKGMLTRVCSSQDGGREQKIYPTKKAQKIHADLENTSDKLYKRMIKNFGESELKQSLLQLILST